MNTDLDLQEALIAWQGGELPPGRADALLERLRTDTAFRQELAREVWTLSLTKVAQSPDPRWLALHEEIGLHEPKLSVIDGGGFEEALMSNVRREPLRFVSAWWRWAATAAAAAVLVLAGALLVQSQREGTSANTETLAVLIHGTDDQPSRAVSAGPVKIAEGQARLLFTNGVILDIEGPADLRLLSASRVICNEGRLRTDVPKGAEGFCVETPRGAVTDLGTVLGISVSRSGKTDVNVFEGQAELATRIPGQEGLRTAVLNQNEKASLQSDEGEITPSDEAAFLGPVEPRVPSLVLPGDYAQRIVAAKPVHYWRLNRAEGETFPSELAEGTALIKAGSVNLESAASSAAGYARFRGPEQPGVLQLAKPWHLPGRAWAVEFWFMPESLDLMSLAALTKAGAEQQHVGLVEIGTRRPGEAHGMGVLRYLMRWPPGRRDGMNLYTAPATALPYQWHHVVVQQSGGDMQLFLNGQAIGSAKAIAAPEDLETQFQIGALEYLPNLSRLTRTFSGCMAEVAVYERVLSAEEISAHASRR